ncbi:MAG: hypothetical protein LC798_08755 [Chloroflexi bacterium]|nr:hypothetical protein [Chloroflexota bacterium]
MRVLQLNIWARYGPYEVREPLYVFVGSLVRWKPRLVIRSSRVVGVDENGAAPSDRYDVLADIELDGDTVGGGRGLDGWDDTHAALWPS